MHIFIIFRGRSKRSRYSRSPSPHHRSRSSDRSPSWDRGFDARNYRVGARYDREREHERGWERKRYSVANYRGASYFRRRSKSRSRSRSRERYRSREDDLRVKIDKQKLRDIAMLVETTRDK